MNVCQRSNGPGTEAGCVTCWQSFAMKRTLSVEWLGHLTIAGTAEQPIP